MKLTGLGKAMQNYLAVISVLFFLVVISHPSQANAEYMTYGEIIESLEKIAEHKLEKSEVVKEEFQSFQKAHGLSNEESVFKEFVRIKMVFEATRDSGLWQLRWAVTDREPNSDAIWAQWQNYKTPKYFKTDEAVATAVAECDELSALFAVISRDLGVKKVGLFWPTWNHTVAVWTTKNKFGKDIRIVVPTSQIFLSETATLGTKEFDPYKQKTIYNYSRKDVKNNFRIPLNLAKMMIRQVEKYGDKSFSYLQEKRNKISKKLGGS